MNRLKQYLEPDEESPTPDGDYWLVFRDLTGGRRRLRTSLVECVWEEATRDA